MSDNKSILEEKEDFIRKMLQYGAELYKEADRVATSMIINDAEILYRTHLDKFQSTQEQREKELVINAHKHGEVCKKGQGTLTTRALEYYQELKNQEK